MIKFELAIMGGLQGRSRNVIQLVGYSDEPLTIVTKLYVGGSLANRIHDLSRAYDSAWIRRIAMDIAMGMSVIHSCNIAHYDLKPVSSGYCIPRLRVSSTHLGECVAG